LKQQPQPNHQQQARQLRQQQQTPSSYQQQPQQLTPNYQQQQQQFQQQPQQHQAHPITQNGSRSFPNKYEPLPRDTQLQCYKCQGFGHVKRYCPEQEDNTQ
jgi:hypothetical protein